jgi:DNA-binding transcriptional LysR family regulator
MKPTHDWPAALVIYKTLIYNAVEFCRAKVSMNRPELELRQLYIFAVVAEELHFGRAAVRLGIAQPPLSQQIKKLEQFIGHTLLKRDTRSVGLTEAGETLLALARKLLQDSSVGLGKVRQAGSGEAGTLNLGFTATTALQMLPKILESLRRRLPEIHVTLIELLPDPLFDALESEQIDVAIAREMIDFEQFEVQELFHETYVAALPARHPCAGISGRLQLKSLSHDDFIWFPRNHKSRNSDQLFEMCRAAGFTPRMAQEAPGWQTAVSFVGSGLGVSILPSCVRSFMLPEVVYKDIDTDVTSAILLMRRRAETRLIVEKFCRIAREAIAMHAGHGLSAKIV